MKLFDDQVEIKSIHLNFGSNRVNLIMELMFWAAKPAYEPRTGAG